MKETLDRDNKFKRLPWRVAITVCPKCNSWSIKTGKYVPRHYRCPDCGWIEINCIKPDLPSFLSKQALHHLRWVYVIFFLVILGGGFLISAMVIAPAKHDAFQDTEGDSKPKSVTTEAPAILAPSGASMSNLLTVSPAGADSVSLHPSEKVRVVANSDSKLYHLPGMKWYNKISSHHRIIFPSEEAARQAGYRKAPR